MIKHMMMISDSMIARLNGIRLSSISRDRVSSLGTGVSRSSIRVSNFGTRLANNGIRLSNFGTRVFTYEICLFVFPYVHDYSLSARAAIGL